MSQRKDHSDCPDCSEPLHRRSFLKAAAGTAVAAGLAAPSLFDPRMAFAAPTMKRAAESAAARLHASLSDAQLTAICFPF